MNKIVGRKLVKKLDSAVSPVIAVMLMLVVTIIIAAVVSGFAGGLANTNNAKAPTLTMDVKIANGGSWTNSGFSALVTGVSEPIKSKDLKLITKWKTTARNDQTINKVDVKKGSPVSGGNISIGGKTNTVCVPGLMSSDIRNSTAPYATGPGVTGEINPNDPTNSRNTGMQFGNYSLVEGTSLYATPYGATCGNAIGIGNAVWGDPNAGYGVAYKPYIYSSDYSSYVLE